jgi:hypothetical protein
MDSKKYFSLLAITGIAASFVFTVPAFAQTSTNQTPGNGWGNQERRQSGVFGKVTAISDTTITITGSRGNKTYTVDASKATFTKDGASSSISGIAVGDTITVQGTVSDTSIAATAIRSGTIGYGIQGSGIMGTVSSVNDNTLTVTSKTGFGAKGQNGTTTTYTVDASNATITKSGATSTVSNIVAGDTVMVKGTVNGTNIVATSIFDGVAEKGKGVLQNQNPIISGDGQPMIAGTVTSINGSTVSVTNKGNNTYTIDASSATIKKGGIENATVSNIAVGDNIVAQGAVTGTSMTASSVIDQGGAPANSTSGSANNNPGAHVGFFGNVINFFKHLFGF